MRLIPDREVLPGVLKKPHFAYFGMLCGHIWIWDACHMAGAANPDLAPTTTIYLAMTIFLLALTVASLLVKTSQKAIARADWPIAALMALGTLALTLPLPAGWPRADVVGVAAVLSGIGIGWTYMQWAYFYASLGVRDAIACIFGAMVVGSALKLPVDLLPTLPAAVVCAALPFASAVLYRRAQAHFAQDGTPDEPVERPYSLRTLQPILKIMLGVAAYGLVIGIMQGMTIEAVETPKVILSGVHHLAEIVAACFVLYHVFVRRRLLHFGNLWQAILVFTSTGVLALPLFGRLLSGWALVAVGVAQTLVVMLLWAMLADIAHRSTLPPIAVFGFGWCAYSLPFPLGHALGALFTLDEAGMSLISVIVYLLAIASVFLLDERDFSRFRIFADLEEPAVSPALFDTMERVCQDLGKSAGLTEREIQVMRLVCQGRSKGYIAETLCISENTVRSHARHLYAKLSVHSKQELLDLMMERMGTPHTGA